MYSCIKTSAMGQLFCADESGSRHAVRRAVCWNEHRLEGATVFMQCVNNTGTGAGDHPRRRCLRLICCTYWRDLASVALAYSRWSQTLAAIARVAQNLRTTGGCDYLVLLACKLSELEFSEMLYAFCRGITRAI